MTYPYKGKNNARYKNTGTHHHKEAESHQQGDGGQYRQFGLEQHTLLLYKGLQMLLIHLGVNKPIV